MERTRAHPGSALCVVEKWGPCARRARLVQSCQIAVIFAPGRCGCCPDLEVWSPSVACLHPHRRLVQVTFCLRMPLLALAMHGGLRVISLGIRAGCSLICTFGSGHADVPRARLASRWERVSWFPLCLQVEVVRFGVEAESSTWRLARR